MPLGQYGEDDAAIGPAVRGGEPAREGDQEGRAATHAGRPPGPLPQGLTETSLRLPAQGVDGPRQGGRRSSGSIVGTEQASSDHKEWHYCSG